MAVFLETNRSNCLQQLVKGEKPSEELHEVHLDFLDRRQFPSRARLRNPGYTKIDHMENKLFTASGRRLGCCQRSQWPGMVVHSYNPSTQEREKDLWVWRQSRLYSETLFQTNKHTRKLNHNKNPGIQRPHSQKLNKRICSFQSHIRQYLWLIHS